MPKLLTKLLNYLLQAVKLSGSVRCLSFAGGNIPAKTQNVIGNQFLDSTTDKWVDVHNPATNQVVTQVHGLRTPNEALFSSKSQIFGIGQTIWADNFWGIWGIFGSLVRVFH